jgi:hypothetical protein
MIADKKDRRELSANIRCLILAVRRSAIIRENPR